MECRTDSDERLQDLEDVPERPDSAHPSEYDAGTEAKPVVGGLMNLDDLGEISIQLITLVSPAAREDIVSHSGTFKRIGSK